MTVSIHQPHFLPWMGYFNKILNSDVFVWLHQVQYRKNYFQNRTKIKDPFANREFWLTIPVHASLTSTIDTVLIADTRWLPKAERTLLQYYKRAPYFDEYFDGLIGSLHVSTSLLEEVNYSSCLYLLRILGFEGKVVRFDSLGVTENDPNLRLIRICQAVGSKHYIAGKGGRNYINQSQWDAEGIRISWQAVDGSKTTYPQLGSSFLAALSVVDALFNIGAERTREVILDGWRVGT